MKKATFLLIIFLMVTSISMAQEKYAVLICGKEVHKDMSVDSSLAEYTGTTGFYHWTEFWAEIYKTWEMLIMPIDSGGMGFKNDYVYVLYADGDDFRPNWIADEYNAQIMHPNIIPSPNGKITDYEATIENVELVFNGLANGQDDFPQLTEDDFLLVWTFGHGNREGNGNVAICLFPNDIEMTDTEFSWYLFQINCYKKVIWMMQCFSGGFIDNLQNANTIINTAVAWDKISNVADDLPVFENEVINDSIYHHTEVYFHLYSAVNQKSPDGRTEFTMANQ